MTAKKYIQFARLLLFINGIAACIGGLLFIADPSGSSMGMSVTSLAFLPFRNYLVPGIVLLLINGISSIIIALLLEKGNSRTFLFLLCQGIVSLLWIIVQAMAIPRSFLQYVFGTIATLLILAGVLLLRFRQSPTLR